MIFLLPWYHVKSSIILADIKFHKTLIDSALCRHDSVFEYLFILFQKIIKDEWSPIRTLKYVRISANKKIRTHEDSKREI